MKKWLLLALLFAGCKKEGHKNNTIPEINIHVLETGTSTQVSGAAVVLMRCNYGCPLGPNVLFTSVTDNAGLVQMPSENYNDPTSFFNITKPKYWNFAVQKRTTMFLTPEGWLQLRLHQAGRYPAGPDRIGTAVVAALDRRAATRQAQTALGPPSSRP